MASDSLTKTYNPDNAITGIEEDIFDFNPTAEKLANDIQYFSNTDSYVIAVNGEWGCGKSSFLSLVQYHLEWTVGFENIVLSFDPWMFSGGEDVVRQLFTHVHIMLQNIHLKSDSKITPDTLKLFENVLSCIGAIADFTFAPPISLAAKIGAFGVKVIEQRHEKKRKKLNNLYIQRENLKKQLATQGVKLILIIDNIDRLTGSEIRSMFQAIKSVSDFPNMVYILAYDQNIVEEALDFEFRQNYTSSPDSGRDYLKKIVQLSLPIPDTTPYLKKYAEEKLLSINQSLTLEKIQSRPKLERRWNALYQNSLSAILKNPRDVIRLYNAMVLVSSTHDSTLDFMDLLSIQVIRDHEPTLYNLIRRNPKYFSNKAYNFTDCNYQANGAVLDDFEHSSEQMRKDFFLPVINTYKSKLHIIYLLCDLFPVIYPAVKQAIPSYEGITCDFSYSDRYRVVNCINAATGTRIQENELVFLRYFGCNIELTDKQLDKLLDIQNFLEPSEFVSLFNQFESNKPPEGRLLLNKILSQIKNYNEASTIIPDKSIRDIMSGIFSLDIESFSLSSHNQEQYRALWDVALEIVLSLLKIDSMNTSVLRLSDEILYTKNIVLLSMLMHRLYSTISHGENWDLRSDYFSDIENLESLNSAKQRLLESWVEIFHIFISDDPYSLLLPNFHSVYRASKITSQTSNQLNTLMNKIWSDESLVVDFIHRAVTEGYLTENNRGLLLNYTLDSNKIKKILHSILKNNVYSEKHHSINVYLTIMDKIPESVIP